MQYTVYLTAKAYQSGEIVVEAASPEAAEAKALRQVEGGEVDVDWTLMSSGEDAQAERVEEQ